MFYNQTVLEILNKPKNAGNLQGANGVAKIVDKESKDVIKLYLKINENEVIEQAKFKTYGSTASIVATNVACDLIKGEKIEDALAVTKSQILDELGNLPLARTYCLALVESAIQMAVADYYKRKARLEKLRLENEAKNI